LLSCLKFARLTKVSVLVSFDGCDDECVLGFVLDSVSPRFTVFVGTSTGSFIGTASILDRGYWVMGAPPFASAMPHLFAARMDLRCKIWNRWKHLRSMHEYALHHHP
jgi:hypothetical protein